MAGKEWLARRGEARRRLQGVGNKAFSYLSLNYLQLIFEIDLARRGWQGMACEARRGVDCKA